MNERLRDFYQRHNAFLILLLLFTSFRLLAILLFRPGGFVTDFSDYDFYYTWGQLIPMGYRAYDNLWTAYPPLFPAIMLRVFELSSRIPPWNEPRLFFHVLFGVTLLLFETGNFILIYRLGNRLGAEDRANAVTLTGGAPLPHGAPLPSGLIAAVIYGMFFTPVYTLIGWFEPMPLFFMLLGLDLLLVNKSWGWTGSAVAAGLGFLTKLTPILLAPIAVRLLGVKLSWRAFRDEWFDRRSPGNIFRAGAYGLILLAVVIAIGYPSVRGNPSLAFSSFQVQSIRPPWQSVWALIDGFYGYGLVPLDMRNLDGLSASLWESQLPWTWIGLAFVALYFWLYTRNYDWRKQRTPIAFSAAGVILLFLYSKGWSPQFLLWILVYIALLLPTMRGVVIAILFSLLNFVEADIFLIMLPSEHWIMVVTVLARTALLILLLIEFISQIWPNQRRAVDVRRFAAYAAWGVVAVTAIAAGVGYPRMANAYQDSRLAAHDCAETVHFLRGQAQWPSDMIVTQQSEVWRDLYPWLRRDYDIYVLDGYSPERPAADVVIEQLDELLANSGVIEFWWIEHDSAPESGSSPFVARERFMARESVTVMEEWQQGACRLMRVGVLPVNNGLADVSVAGGSIKLVDAVIGEASIGGHLPVVLYWQIDEPIDDSYTVFTQLLDADGQLVAQQDNLPVNGMAPTNTWLPGVMIRDPYWLDLSRLGEPGSFQLHAGLYDQSGARAHITLQDGTVADHIAFPVRVTAE